MAGCVPVIIADEIELPYENFLDWSQLVIKAVGQPPSIGANPRACLSLASRAPQVKLRSCAYDQAHMIKRI